MFRWAVGSDEEPGDRCQFVCLELLGGAGEVDHVEVERLVFATDGCEGVAKLADDDHCDRRRLSGAKCGGQLVGRWPAGYHRDGDECVVVGIVPAPDEGVGPAVLDECGVRLGRPCQEIFGMAIPGVDDGEVVEDIGAVVDDIADGDDSERVGEWTERQLGDDRAGKIRGDVGVAGERQDPVCFEIEVELCVVFGLADGHNQRRRTERTVVRLVVVRWLDEGPDRAVVGAAPAGRGVGVGPVEQDFEAGVGVTDHPWPAF